MEFLSQKEVEILLGIDKKQTKKLSKEELSLLSGIDLSDLTKEEYEVVTDKNDLFSFLYLCRKWENREVDCLKDELEKLEKNEENCVKKIVQDILEDDSYIKSIYPLEKDVAYYGLKERNYWTVEKIKNVLISIIKKIDKNEYVSINQIYKELNIGNIGSIIILKK